MSTLSKEYRRQLENTVLKARGEAERGAFDALNVLGLTETKIPPHLNDDEQKFRRLLRAHGKQVGDTQISDKEWDISHLIHECAYEHWHRMLFARFLAENGFLIEPDSGLDVDLDFCEERARETKSDKWEVAAGFAQRMLTAIFRPDDPVLQLRLPAESRNRLTALLASLPREVFLADDSLGWVYQFWQAKKKEEVNDSGVKIGAGELPSVTQLFTEDYMVDFLLDNTLGAWHAGKVLAANPKLAENAKSEEELRKTVALPGCPWKYLRFIKGKDGKWTPAAGTFDGWPKTARELKCLDPCMGSGHFVVAMFERLVALRLAEEKLDEAAAVAAVIRNNLFGLEIDPRCTQIGAFNLALAAWRRVGHRPLPAMNLACSGLAPNTREADWLAIVDAASSRPPKDKPERQDASATFAPINYFRPDEPVANLTGNLPHWRQAGTTYFVTFRCADALPQEKLHQWRQELAQWQAAHPEPHDHATRQEFYERFPQRIQTWLDSGYGECVLREPAMGEIVESALRHFDGQRYRLAEFVVAANHVHALVTPLGEHLLSDILHSWKSFTANEINEARKKSGTFWQKESFDHIVRSPASLARFREYILSHNKVAEASSRSQPEGERLEAAATMRLRAGMERLYRLFQKAAVLGSLINPRAGEGDLLVASFHELQPLLEKALKVEDASSLSSDQKGKSLEGSATLHEMAVTARGLAKAAEILAGQFTLVATNVPYLGRGKQDEVLQDYCERVHPEAKADLATCFVERCLEFCAVSGSTSLVTPQNWLFLATYKSMRERSLRGENWNVICRLGPGAFETIGGEVVSVTLLVIARAHPTPATQSLCLDATGCGSPSDKASAIRTIPPSMIPQADQLANPDAIVAVERLTREKLLETYASGLQGISSADNARFRICFWEIVNAARIWAFMQSSPPDNRPYGGRENMLWWGADGRALSEANPGAALRGEVAHGKWGVAVARMAALPTTLYSGELFDDATAIISPRDKSHVPAIWAFCSSGDFQKEVRRINQKVSVANATLVKVPFDLAHWQKVAAEKYPHGLPKPFSSDPTQWLFNGHPAGADQPLHVAVARLLGYHWPRQTGSSFQDCPALGPDGLEKHADNDGVVCFSQVRDEPPAATRLRALLADNYGKEWSHAIERKLIAASGSTAESLEEWLLNDFFAQHCDLFHNRPFVWHIWDGRKDGFNVLVNYHKLAGPKGEGHRTLETLTYACLGDWLARQKDAVTHGEAGADDRLAAALELQGELKKIVAGEPPYDLFIRWRPLHQQPIGWEADINDGVRLNIRPFMVATLSRGKKGCGLFRAKPGSSVKWEKDRGKEPSRPKEDFPWFWKWDEQKVDFTGNGESDGNRWNDCHYTTAFKRAARERKAKT